MDKTNCQRSFSGYVSPTESRLLKKKPKLPPDLARHQHSIIARVTMGFCGVVDITAVDSSALIAPTLIPETTDGASSRVRGLAHSGSYGDHAGHGLQVAPAHCTGRECISHPPQQRVSARVYHRATREEAFANTFSTWGRPKPHGAVCPPARRLWTNGPALSNEGA